MDMDILDSDKDGWDEVVEDFLLSSQEASDHALEAEACKSESCTRSEAGDSSDGSRSVLASPFSPGHKPNPVAWWAQQLKMHTRKFEVPSQSRQITVVSACAGLWTEGEALKAGSRVGYAGK